MKKRSECVLLAHWRLYISARHLIRDLAEMNVSPEIRQELDAQRIKLAAIEVPAQVDIDIAIREAIRRSIDESFVAGFRVVMVIASGLALGSAATAWLVIRDKP